MATQTIIDGGKQAITFNNDTEPVAVYVDGELQQNVSFVPQLAQGTGVVSYSSEYKKNHIEIDIEGNTTQSVLPREYQEVEYIESTGTQYIDTGIVASPLFEMVAVAQYTQNYAGTSGNAWSGISASPSRIGFGYASSISSSNFAVLFASASINTGIPFDTNKHEFVIKGNVTGKWSIDGSTGNTTGNVDSEFSKGTLPLILFARNAASGVGNLFKMRLYSFKFTDNNVLIRDFIPCYRKADNEIGLFDLVNGEFYTNQGTDTFLKGTDYSTPPTPDYPQTIENANSEGMSVVLHGDNLIPFGFDNYQSGRTYTNNGITFTMLADGGVRCKGKKTASQAYTILSQTKRLQRYGAGTYAFSLQGDVPAGTAITLNVLRNGINTQYGSQTPAIRTLNSNEVMYRLTLVINTTDEIDNIVYPMINYGSEYLPYKIGYFKEIAIPTSVEVEGVTVSLRFAGEGDVADKLVVDRINNKVEYIQKFTQYQMQGDEVILGTATTTNGNTEATFILSSPLPDDSNYLLQWCNCAQNMAVATSNDRDLFEVFKGNNYCLARFKFLNCASETDMRNIFIDKVNNGEPVAVQYVLATPISHTLSGTTFGQSLLNLATENQTNYFEVTGNANAPETPIKLTYAKWGELVENNGNT